MTENGHRVHAGEQKGCLVDRTIDGMTDSMRAEKNLDLVESTKMNLGLVERADKNLHQDTDGGHMGKEPRSVDRRVKNLDLMDRTEKNLDLVDRREKDLDLVVEQNGTPI